jgi:tryptophan synthase alpha chain
MPFVTAGDPDLDFTCEVIRRLAACGCGLFELGIPYSDPVADGPVIQASYTRVLDKKLKLADILAAVGGLTPRLPAPIVTMLSYSIVFRHGLERYVADARAAGVSGAIVPDLPVEESGPLAEICRREDFSLIQLITPTTPRDRALRIAEKTTGFIYYVSVAGITGERTVLPPEIVENVGWLREQTPLPICIGFGISRPEHVRMLAPVADGLIVGSAIVRHVAEASRRPQGEVLKEIEGFVGELLKELGAMG